MKNGLTSVKKASEFPDTFMEKNDGKKMLNQFSRTELLLGAEGMEKLRKSRVAVFGVGGVGGYVVEALARSGVGTLDLIDDDKVCITNVNRQIIATMDSVGKYKVDVAKERILQINPEAVVNACKVFYLPETEGQFDFSEYDYVVDAIDTVKGKIALVLNAQNSETPIICSMGAGNKMHPELFEIADIYETSVCPLARVMRQELKKLGVKSLKVVYSKEKPVVPAAGLAVEMQSVEKSVKKAMPGSNAFVPSAAGLIIAGQVIRDITGWKD